MKRLVLVTYFLLLSLSLSFGQGETNNWYFGFGTGLRVDFNTSPPTVTRGYPLTTEEGSCVISTSAGVPLFYTDGLTIWDASTNVAFGTGLLGGKSSTQSAVIMPKPGATNQWLMFTSNTDPGTGTPGGLNYYTISGSPGAFSISSATNLASGTAVGEGLCIIGNTSPGNSFWVISRERSNGAGSRNIRAYSVSNTGVVNPTPVISSIPTANSFNDYIGTIKANTCQTQIAFTYYNDGIVELYDFNTNTGAVTNLVASRSVPHAYGLEFSPNDQYLYISQLDEGQLHQYNISAGTNYAPPAWDRAGEMGQLQLGPDGKIYVALTGGGSSPEYLGVINAPNAATAAANFVFNGLQLNTVPATDGYCYRGLPTFSKSLVVTNPIVSPAGGTYCTGATIPLSFTFAGSINPGTILWTATGGGHTFTPGGTSSTATNPSVSFSTTGAKTVTVTFNDICGRVFTQTINLTITSPKIPAGSISCSTGAITLTATGTPASDHPNYVWYNAASGGSILGVGSSVTLNYPNDTYAPASVWVEVGGTVTTTTSGTNRTIGMAPGGLTWAANPSNYGPVPFNVLASVVTLRSFVVKSWNTTGNFDVEIRNSANTVVFLRTYNITTANVNFTVNIDMTLPADNYTIRLINNSHQWHGGTWTGGTNAGEVNVPTFGGPGTYSIANYVYDYKTFSVTPTCSNRIRVDRLCSLPVDLLNFTGYYSEGKVNLSWITSSEINNDFFTVLRSAQGSIFEPLSTIKGKGSATSLSYYSFTDDAPLFGKNYYKIAQHDYDGNISYSHTITIHTLPEIQYQITPNPSASDFVLHAENAHISSVTLCDLYGRVLQNYYLTDPQNKITFGERLKPGTYLIYFTADEARYSDIIVKY